MGCGGVPEGTEALLLTLLLTLLLRLHLLRSARLAELLDLAFRQILVLGAHHSEHRGGSVRATRDRTKLNRSLAALAQTTQSTRTRSTQPEPRGRTPAEGIHHHVARARHRVLLDQRRQAFYKLLNHVFHLGTSCHSDFPLVAAESTDKGSARQRGSRVLRAYRGTADARHSLRHRRRTSFHS